MKKLQELKNHHLYMIMEELLLTHSATMQELMLKTGLSQPSVRNMIRYLQEEGYIEETGIDLSTGGRCPVRFTLSKKQFRVLSIYVLSHEIQYRYDDKEETIEYKNEDHLKEVILLLIKESYCTCCCIGVEGIVKHDVYLTDHQDEFIYHYWFKELNEEVNIPIYLENDVKAMHLGEYYTHSLNRSVYLHVNEVGIGSSYIDNISLYGKNGIAGEIGLLHYNGITLNKRVRDCKNQDEFNEIISYLLLVIYTMLDPKEIYLSISIPWQVNEEYIKKYLKKYIFLDIPLNITISKDYQELLFYGLKTIGTLNLIKKITGEKNEKV